MIVAIVVIVIMMYKPCSGKGMTGHKNAKGECMCATGFKPNGTHCVSDDPCQAEGGKGTFIGLHDIFTNKAAPSDKIQAQNLLRTNLPLAKQYAKNAGLTKASIMQMGNAFGVCSCADKNGVVTGTGNTCSSQLSEGDCQTIYNSTNFTVVGGKCGCNLNMYGKLCDKMGYQCNGQDEKPDVNNRVKGQDAPLPLSTSLYTECKCQTKNASWNKHSQHKCFCDNLNYPHTPNEIVNKQHIIVPTFTTPSGGRCAAYVAPKLSRNVEIVSSDQSIRCNGNYHSNNWGVAYNVNSTQYDCKCKDGKGGSKWEDGGTCCPRSMAPDDWNKITNKRSWCNQNDYRDAAGDLKCCQPIAGTELCIPKPFLGRDTCTYSP